MSLKMKILDFVLAVLLFLTLCLVAIGAGHGGGFVGQFLLMGWPAWMLPNLLALISVGVLIASTAFLQPPTRGWFVLGGLVLSAASFAAYAWLSEVLVWITAIPYIVLWVVLLWRGISALQGRQLAG